MIRQFVVTALTAAAIFISGPWSLDARATELQTVLGEVRFEKRSTIVPLAICEQEPCAKPTVYWSLVLKDERTRYRYEVNKIFALGSSVAPDYVEIAGTRVTPGTHLELEGYVQEFGMGYALISEINRASVIDQWETMWETMDTDEYFLPMVHGWKCLSTESRVPLRVNVIYAGKHNWGDRFEIQVSRNEESLAAGPVANAPDATQSVDDDRIIFRGKSEEAILQVLIDRSMDRFVDVPSYLTITKDEPGALIVFDLLCSRARF